MHTEWNQIRSFASFGFCKSLKGKSIKKTFFYWNFLQGFLESCPNGKPYKNCIKRNEWKKWYFYEKKRGFNEIIGAIYWTTSMSFFCVSVRFLFGEWTLIFFCVSPLFSRNWLLDKFLMQMFIWFFYFFGMLVCIKSYIL